MSQYAVLNGGDLDGTSRRVRDQSTHSFDLDPDPSKWLEEGVSPGYVNWRPARSNADNGMVLAEEDSKPIRAADSAGTATSPAETDHPTLASKKDDTDGEEQIYIFAELKRFAKLSAPNTIVMFLMYLQWTATLTIAAKYLGTEEMTGVSLASLTANLSALTVVYGLLSAVDTLAPQSFGAGNMAEVGILVQRGILTVFSTFIITAIIWYNSESILLGLGQPKKESELAATFLHYHFMSVPALALWESARRFMWSQDVTQWPFVICTIVSLGIHLLCLYLLIPALGFVGTPVSHVITNWSMVIGVALWIKIKRPHNPDTWTYNRHVVMNRQAMKTFLKLAVPGILSMSEWVFFEFFIFLSGTLGPKELAANSVAYTLIPISYTIPSGLSIATTARVGALLAQGRVKSAKALTRAVGIVTLCLATLISTIVFIARDSIIGAFSSEEDVQELATSVWIYLCVFLFLDATFGVQCGLLRALGLQLLYALLVLICLFIIGLPVIASLAFKWGSNLGLLGMWIGVPGAYILLNISMFIAHRVRNWSKYSQEIVERERLLKSLREEESSSNPSEPSPPVGEAVELAIV